MIPGHRFANRRRKSTRAATKSTIGLLNGKTSNRYDGRTWKKEKKVIFVVVVYIKSYKYNNAYLFVQSTLSIYYSSLQQTYCSVVPVGGGGGNVVLFAAVVLFLRRLYCWRYVYYNYYYYYCKSLEIQQYSRRIIIIIH